MKNTKTKFIQSSKKLVFLAIFLIELTGSCFSQYRSLQTTIDNLENLELIQIDQVDQASLLHFKLRQEKGSQYCLARDLVVFDPSSYSIYSVYEGINVPLCDEGNQVFEDSIHHFTIAVEKLPEGIEQLQLKAGQEVLKEIKVDWESRSTMLNMIGFHSVTPYRYLNLNYVDGKTVLVFTTKDYVVAAQQEFVNEYGKFQRIHLTIVNKSDRSFVLDPSQFSGYYSMDRQKSYYDATLWTHEAYMLRVETRQGWSSLLNEMSEQADVKEAATSTTTSTSSYTGHSNTNSSAYSSYNSGYLSGNSSTNASLYGSTKSTTEDAQAKFQAQQRADANVATYDQKLENKREELHAGYLKLNTIRPNVQIDGFIQYKYDKKATNLQVQVPVGDDVFIFEWYWY